jgi:hypothetical protein
MTAFRRYGFAQLGTYESGPGVPSMAKEKLLV